MTDHDEKPATLRGLPLTSVSTGRRYCVAAHQCEYKAQRIAELEAENAALKEDLARATEFSIVEPCREFTQGLIVMRRRQRIGPAKWSVNSGANILHADGTWELEPHPSGRSDEFLASTRFTLEEALERANQLAGDRASQ